jgi:hypothetical protein
MDDHLNHKSEEAKKACLREQERQRIIDLTMTIKQGELEQVKMQNCLDLEEKEAKDLLNLKITAEQKLEDLSILAKAEEKLRLDNRENQIKLQLK